MKTATSKNVINQAENLNQLLAQLGATPIAIPAGHGRQRSEAVERWTAHRLLAALGQGNRLAFPLSMRKQEKPDFFIEAGAGRIGLEATIATSPNFAKCRVLRDEEFPDAFIDMGLFRSGTPELTKDEMRAVLASGKLSGPPYMGNSLERDWAVHIESRITDKQAKLGNPDFSRYDKNWLVIHDILPCYSLDDGVDLLMPMLEARWSNGRMFDEIFIEHTEVIVCISQAGVTGRLPIPDLWGSTKTVADACGA